MGNSISNKDLFKVMELIRQEGSIAFEDKKAILNGLSSMKGPEEQEVKFLIEDIIIQCGVSPNNLGYDYLITAVELVTGSPNRYRGSVVKSLYPDIAHLYDSRSPRVERCIRHSIQCAFRDYPDNLKEALGLAWKESYTQECPTNAEFIYMLACLVKRKLSSRDAT